MIGLRRASCLLASLLAALVGSPALAAEPSTPEPAPLPSVLTLDEAVRLLRERGLDLLIAEAAVRSAEGDLRVAGAVANPSLSATYGRSFTYGACTGAGGAPAGCGILPDGQYGAGISDSGAIADAVSGKRGLRIRTAQAAHAAARASRADALRNLEAQVRGAFVQVLVSREGARFASDVAAASARTLQLTQDRYDAGAISEADLARVQVAKLGSDQAQTSATQALRDAKVSLAFLLGVRTTIPDYDVSAPDLLHPSAKVSLRDASPATLIERARALRPDLAAARSQRERAEAALALARRQRFPDVSLSINYTQQGTTASAVTPPTLTAGLSFALPVFSQQQGEIQKAEADLATQRFAAEKVEATVVSEVESAWSGFQSAATRTQRMQGGLLERAARARDLVEIQYRKGAASLLDFLDAQRTFIATNVELLDDLSAYWTSFFRLEQAVGEDLS